MSVAIGMGATLDSSGFSPVRTRAIPSFAVVGDIGDGVAGFGMGVYASSASGRYRPPDVPVDRLGLDVMAVLRPLAPRVAAGGGYLARAAGASGIELGLGLERDGLSALSGYRFGVHTGLRLELPLTPVGEPAELRLHVAVRHLIGLYEPLVASTSVGDTTELIGALAVSF